MKFDGDRGILYRVKIRKSTLWRFQGKIVSQINLWVRQLLTMNPDSPLGISKTQEYQVNKEIFDREVIYTVKSHPC